MTMRPHHIQGYSHCFRVFTKLIDHFTQPSIIHFRVCIISLKADIISSLTSNNPILSILSVITEIFHTRIIHLHQIIDKSSFLSRIFLGIDFPVHDPHTIQVDILMSSRTFGISLIPEFISILEIPCFGIRDK